MAETITRYRAKSKQGALETVDFSTVAGKRFAFFEVREPARLEEVKRLIATPQMAQMLVVAKCPMTGTDRSSRTSDGRGLS